MSARPRPPHIDATAQNWERCPVCGVLDVRDADEMDANGNAVEYRYSCRKCGASYGVALRVAGVYVICDDEGPMGEEAIEFPVSTDPRVPPPTMPAGPQEPRAIGLSLHDWGFLLVGWALAIGAVFAVLIAAGGRR